MKNILLVLIYLIAIQSLAQPNRRLQKKTTGIGPKTPGLTQLLRKNTLWLDGTQLKDPCNNPIVSRAISKMTIFDQNDLTGQKTYPQIAQTGANCVRIVWGMGRIANGAVIATTAAELDSVITNAKKNNMLPMIGLWDFTDDHDGGFSKLQLYVDYWKRPDIVAVINKHQDQLLIGICNECGVELNNEDDPDEMNSKMSVFVQQYANAISQIRQAGINVPLIVDGIDRGKSLHGFSFKRQGQTQNVAQELQAIDTQHNTIFSVHPYWPLRGGASATFITNKFQEATNNKIPFIVGEFAKFGAFTSSSSDPCSSDGEVNYQLIANLCQQNNIGYAVWEWGPGNLRLNGSPCPELDLTTNGSFTSLKDWGLDIVNNPVYGIKATSKKTPYFDRDCFCENVRLTVSNSRRLDRISRVYEWSSTSANIQSYVLEITTKATAGHPSTSKSLKIPATLGLPLQSSYSQEVGNATAKLRVFRKNGSSCYVTPR